MFAALAGDETKASRRAGQDSSDLKVNTQTAGHGRGCTAWKSRGKCDRGTAQGVIETCTIKDPSKCMFWYEVDPLAEQHPSAACPQILGRGHVSERMRKNPSLLPSLWFSQRFHSAGCSSASVLSRETESPEIPCLFSDNFSSLISTWNHANLALQSCFCVGFLLDFVDDHIPYLAQPHMLKYLVWAIATAIKPMEMPCRVWSCPEG